MKDKEFRFVVTDKNGDVTIAKIDAPCTLKEYNKIFNEIFKTGGVIKMTTKTIEK